MLSHATGKGKGKCISIFVTCYSFPNKPLTPPSKAKATVSSPSTIPLLASFWVSSSSNRSPKPTASISHSCSYMSSTRRAETEVGGSDLDLRSKAKTLPGINNALAALEAIDVDVAEEVMMVGCVTRDMINGLVDGVSGTCNGGSRAMPHTPP
ncbi:hypothetical protein DVH24_026305 [Malus domestica]|uniref:Uncharacterized protein n=1 Tax=Malus domestica TaxID=3750 RepID=A0A498KG67_MALDO|nr:hypothetical protein DVH24_026305 [Malus domestica]